MVKPPDMYSWTQLRSRLGIPEDFKPSIARRNAELLRMFPDINCDFENSLQKTMSYTFIQHRKCRTKNRRKNRERNPSRRRASPLKGKSADSGNDSPD